MSNFFWASQIFTISMQAYAKFTVKVIEVTNEDTITVDSQSRQEIV